MPKNLFLFTALLAVTACDFHLDNEALIERARAAAERDEHRAAIIDLKAVLQREPGDAKARLALGQVYLEVGDPYAAEKELRKAVEFGMPESDVVVPLGQALLAQQVFDLVLAEIEVADAAQEADRIALMLIRADAHLGLGHAEQARNLYVKALGLDSENPAAYLGMSSISMLEGQPEQAAISIDRAIEADSDFAAAWLSRATFRLNQRLVDAAKSDFEKALDLATARSERSIVQTALAGLTDIHLLQGDLEAAESRGAALNAMASDSVVARYTAARVAVAKGDIDKAVVLLQGVLKDAPDFRQAHLLYGAVSRARGNLAQAEMYLESAVRAWPENAEARKLLADVRLRQHKFRGATEAIEPLLNDEAQADDYLLAAAGVVKLQAGEYEEGLDLFRRSAAADPGNLERKMDLAAIYLAVGQVDQATEILESLAGTGVDKHRLDVLNVVSLQRRGDDETAIRMAERLLDLSPDNIQLLTVLSGLYRESGDYSAARGALERAIQLDAGNVDVLLRWGRLDIEEYRYRDAKSRFQRAFQVAPESAAVAMEMARLAKLQGDAATAVSWLERARQTSKDALMPRIHLATHYLSQGRHQEAQQVAEEAVRVDQEDARARNLLGVIQMATGDFSAALGNFREAIRLDPDMAVYRFNESQAELRRGNRGTALRLMEENYEAHPYHVPSATLLADQYLRNQGFEDASRVARQLQTALPDNAAGLALQGDILAAQGRLLDAIDMYDSALRIEPSRDLAMRGYRLRVKAAHSKPLAPLLSYLETRPSDALARMFLAEAYHVRGEFPEAAAEYERVIASDPDNVAALNNLALILLDDGDPRALELAEAAYRILPDNGAVMDTYGWVMFNNGRSRDASEILRKAVQKTPGDSEMLYHLAAVLLDLGEDKEAYLALERILTSDEPFPSRQDAEQLLKGTRSN